jgi:hypothetical protein
MFHRELTLLALRKQHGMLLELEDYLSSRPALGVREHLVCGVKTAQVADNLKKLRDIQAGYCRHIEGGGPLEAMADRSLPPDNEWHRWRLRAGLAPEAGCAVSRTGLYADFT